MYFENCETGLLIKKKKKSFGHVNVKIEETLSNFVNFLEMKGIY